MDLPGLTKKRNAPPGHLVYRTAASLDVATT